MQIFWNIHKSTHLQNKKYLNISWKTLRKSELFKRTLHLRNLKVIVHRLQIKIPCHGFTTFPLSCSIYSSFLCHSLTSTNLSSSESGGHDRMIKCLHTYFIFGPSKKIAPTVRKIYTKDSTTITFIYQTFASYFSFYS